VSAVRKFFFARFSRRGFLDQCRAAGSVPPELRFTRISGGPAYACAHRPVHRHTHAPIPSHTRSPSCSSRIKMTRRKRANYNAVSAASEEECESNVLISSKRSGASGVQPSNRHFALQFYLFDGCDLLKNRSTLWPGYTGIPQNIPKTAGMHCCTALC